MEPNIIFQPPLTLIGMHESMTLAENTTTALWRRFMPRRHEIQHRTTSDYISMQVYGDGKLAEFLPQVRFEKWAVVEVANCDVIPKDMAEYRLQGGTYAVFVHRGLPSDFPKTMERIYGQWLPSSEYELDAREHFERLPEGYSPLDPEAEEEIWIPVKRRG